MKKYQITFSEEAKSDLQNIYTYVKDISSLENAESVIKRIIEKASSLDIFPERTEPFGKDKDNQPIRVTADSKYRILYIVKRKEKVVLIARIVSLSQDFYNL